MWKVWIMISMHIKFESNLSEEVKENGETHTHILCLLNRNFQSNLTLNLGMVGAGWRSMSGADSVNMVDDNHACKVSSESSIW